MDELITNILTEVQYLAKERKIKLEYDCCRTPSPIKGEALQLKREVARLLHNALNYTPAGGFIRVSLCEQTQYLLVEVVDNGPAWQRRILKIYFIGFTGLKERGILLGLDWDFILQWNPSQSESKRFWHRLQRAEE